ncbi:MAG: 2-dehydro-3-deoxyphosphogluconate aldolase [Atopobiaceae bacterium]|jgi:2-dehydro-3-deoxyphosphogluconate aldolase/(4S)-4-hydroxy-2-oxoglutarate aldolase|nr:2-dehydro-3-deoxyphosphogluconate aldolase [Atopobiaceae bacterium]
MAVSFEGFYTKLQHAGIVPMASLARGGDAARLADVVAASGLAALEVELMSADALDAVRAARAAHPELLLGVGTVRSTDQADAAAECGADYVSTPSFDAALAEHCIARGLPCIPVTVDEGGIFKADRLGLTATGIIPANDSGALGSIERFSAAFGGHLFMPRGGVTAENLAVYLRSDAVIACGSPDWPTAPALLEAGEYDAIAASCAQAATALAAARG